VGIGPAAASYLGGERRVNRPDVDAYMHALEAGAEPPYEGERLEPPEAMAEALMLGLRLTEGVDRSAFARRYGKDPSKAFPMTVGRHLELRTLVLTQSHLRLAPEAFFVANSVLADFFAEVR
jgi:oxygen-independent coproporphyrinogen-3 oxidase